MRRLPFHLFAFAISSVTYQANAQIDDNAQNQIEKIVVTTELIDRSFSDSAYSTEVFSEERLKAQAGLETMRDILEATSNITVVTGTGKGPTVRGVDGTGAAENAIAFFAGSRARISWQLDNRPANYNEIIFSDLGIYDLHKIELLRGSQSTLVGRNAIAGTMVVKTNDPTFAFDSSAQIVSGNYDQLRTSAMMNLPLINDTLAVRLVADFAERDSAVKYESYEGIDAPGDIKSKSLRAKLLYFPHQDIRWLLTLNHNKYRAPNGEIIVRPFKDRISNVPQQPVHEPKTDSIVSEFSWDVNDYLQFLLLTSASDFTFTRYAVPNTSNATINTKEYVIEPRLSYQSSSGFSGVSGVYVYKADQDEYIEFAGGTNFIDETRTFALYTEGLQPLTETVDLSFGLRYERESRTRVGNDVSNLFVQVDSDDTYTALLPKLSVNWQATESSTFGAQISRGYNAGGSGVAFVIPLENFDYDKETVWTLEAYGRHLFSDTSASTRLSINYNFFYSDYTDMQLPFDLTPEDSRDEAFVVRNADEVVTYGAELGVDYQLTDSFNMFANVGLLHTDITSYPNSGVEGNELLTAPSYTANVGVNYQYQQLSSSVFLRYSDGYYSDVNNRPRGKTDSYTVVDAKVSYALGDIELFFAINNLFDSKKAVAFYPNTDSANDTAVLLQPRLASIGVRWNYQ